MYGFCICNSMTLISYGTSMAVFKESPNNENQLKKSQTGDGYEWKIIWRNVIIFCYIHLAAIYGLYLSCFRLKFASFLWCNV